VFGLVIDDDEPDAVEQELFDVPLLGFLVLLQRLKLDSQVGPALRLGVVQNAPPAGLRFDRGCFVI